jgi:HEPN domain-containing protein
MTETEQTWVDQAQYDIDTARAMLASGRYLYVMFCCQQASEKALKAVIVRKTGTLPPRTHNLLRLAEAAGVGSDKDNSVSWASCRPTTYKLVILKKSARPVVQ